MKKRLIEACAFMLLLVACTTLVFGIAGCKPKLTTDDSTVTPPIPQVDDSAVTITPTDSDDRSWVTWTECSQKPGDHPDAVAY